MAEALALDGCRVTVIEQSVIGGGATAAGMGHVVVMDDSEAQIALTQYSQKLWDQRGETLPKAGERLVCGTLWVAMDDEEMTEVHRKREFYLRRGIAAEVLDEKSLREAEPNLRPGLIGGLLVPGDWVVYPPPIAAAMLGFVKQTGGSVQLGSRVTAMSLIGPHPRDANLLLATGHEGLGITTSLGTARLIADHLAGRTPEISAEPYLPNRLWKERHAC